MDDMEYIYCRVTLCRYTGKINIKSVLEYTLCQFEKQANTVGGLNFDDRSFHGKFVIDVDDRLDLDE